VLGVDVETMVEIEIEIENEVEIEIKDEVEIPRRLGMTAHSITTHCLRNTNTTKHSLLVILRNEGSLNILNKKSLAINTKLLY